MEHIIIYIYILYIYMNRSFQRFDCLVIRADGFDLKHHDDRVDLDSAAGQAIDLLIFVVFILPYQTSR